LFANDLIRPLHLDWGIALDFPTATGAALSMVAAVIAEPNDQTSLTAWSFIKQGIGERTKRVVVALTD
jgi:hypothetical protein